MGDFIDSVDFPFYRFLFFIYGESVMKLKTITITHYPNKEFTHSFTQFQQFYHSFLSPSLQPLSPQIIFHSLRGINNHSMTEMKEMK